MISLVLVEPKTSGNVGAIARCMKNFGFKNLVIVNPQCRPLSKEALNRAKHAKDILRNAKIVKKIPESFDYLIGTTSKLGTDYNLPRTPIRPDELARIIKPGLKAGILIGREGDGLYNDEIRLCDFVVTIPTSKDYPAMNSSFAAAIILYELSKADNHNKIGKTVMAGKKEKEVILKLVDKNLDKMSFSTKEKRETQRIFWKRLIGKSFLTRREAFTLMGFLRKL
ncbi:RNA methyltransferase [Candidatus Woesearchaeota archaeon]|nr:MAG: RNA methyltransferase [Candidatus Woesearchaeota archaeon]